MAQPPADIARCGRDRRAPGLLRGALLVAAGGVTIAVGAGAWALVSDRPHAPPSARVADVLGSPASDAGFDRVGGPRPIRFPDDEGAHPTYRTEWWYYTGNLAVPAGEPDAGRRFGVELTFFRNALAAAAEARASAWATNQAYMSHFALSDVDAGHFAYRERFARGAAGLAGAVASPFRVWLDDWSASSGAAAPGDRPGEVARLSGVRLRASDDGRAIDLVLSPVKPAVLHGDRGYSRKGPEPANASLYYSYTRLAATGAVTTPDGAFPVSGLAWMDHEWSTSALSPEEVGWDWFALQLDDGRELMLYRIRRADGTVSEASSGSLVDANGDVVALDRSDVAIEASGTWRSPHSGVEYPSGWQVLVPEERLSLRVEPLLADQELNVALRYWEGAVRVTGVAKGQTVSGFGYVELTGYE